MWSVLELFAPYVTRKFIFHMVLPLPWPRRSILSLGTIIRVLADAVILQFAMIAALSVRLIYSVAFEDMSAITPFELAQKHVGQYCYSMGPLTAICLFVFFASGFYTRGRYYQGRYKVLVIFQAVTIAYGTFGFLYMFFSGALEVPRGAFFIAWSFSVLLLVSARVWTEIWERFVIPERERRIHLVNESNRQVLVIGGAGYIGSALLPKLLNNGFQVRLLDALIYGDGPIQAVSGHPNLDIIEGDFRHVENVVEAMRNVHAVVHLGAIVGDPACNLDEDLTIDINLSATRMIAELAKTQGVSRFIFASTCSVYGACDEILDEHSQIQPVSLYGHTKAASEKILLDMADDQFSPTILRFATVYGLSGRTRFDLVVNLLTAKAKIDGKISIFGGQQWRPFVHVDDAAASVVRVLESEIQLVAAHIFNVGSNKQNYTISEIGELVHQQVMGSTIHTIDGDDDPRNYRVDFRKIHNRLGFQPNWTVERGIDQVLQAILNGDISDYRDVEYSNVKFLLQEGTTALARDHWARELVRDFADRDME